MRIRIPLVFASVLVVASTVPAKDKAKTFSAPIDKVFDAAIQITKAHYIVEGIDRQEHILTFHTGVNFLSYGIEVTTTFNSEPNGKTTVTARPAKRGPQLFAWGQGGRIVDKFFNELKDWLKDPPDCHGIILLASSKLRSAAQEAKSENLPDPLYDWEKTWGKRLSGRHADLSSCPDVESLQQAARSISSHRHQQSVNNFWQGVAQGAAAGEAAAGQARQTAQRAAQNAVCQEFVPGETEYGEAAMVIVDVPCAKPQTQEPLCDKLAFGVTEDGSAGVAIITVPCRAK